MLYSRDGDTGKYFLEMSVVWNLGKKAPHQK